MRYEKIKIGEEEKEIRFKYNLQFFSEEGESDGEDKGDAEKEGIDEEDTDESQSVDASAFAEIISEKDKKIEELEAELKKTKKENANLLLKVSAGAKEEKTFDENLLSLVGAKPRKE